MTTNKTVEERFWPKVNKTEGGCWTAVRSARGYGMFRLEGRMRYTHVLTYLWAVGEKPPGTELDHLCRNRACCNPAHLEPVTHAVNCQRGDVGKASGAAKLAKTHCPKGHTYADAYTTKGWRQCRTCQIEYSRRAKARKRAERTAA